MDTLTLAVVGAAYGTSLAVGVCRRAWRRQSTAEGLLALLLGCAVVAILTIVLQHRLDGGFAEALLERIELVATLSAGPALLLYVRSVTGPGALRRRELLHFAPALVAASVPAALAAPIELLLAHQVTYTALALRRRIRRREEVRHQPATSWALLGIMAVVHLAQMVRLATAGSPLLIDVVPATLSVALLCGGALAAIAFVTHEGRARGLRRRRATGHTTKVAPPAAADVELLERLDRLMQSETLYRRPELGLHDLAAALGASPHRLSAALNTIAGVTLTGYLTRLRLADAKRRLLDPAHAIYTIDAIGERSGFGSRSGFYAAFRREVGTTPTRFRARHQSPPARRPE